MRVSQGSWSIEKHPSWAATEHPECLTLTLSDEGGALQLSSARKSEGSVTPADIQWCIEQLPAGSAPTTVTLGEFSGANVVGDIDGTYWSWWILGCGLVLLRVSYNGPPLAKAIELPHVDSMLASLAAA